MNAELNRCLDLLESLIDGFRELRKAGIAGSAEAVRTLDEIYNSLSDIEMNERGAAVTKAVGALQRAGAEIPVELKAEIAAIQTHEKDKQK